MLSCVETVAAEANVGISVFASALTNAVANYFLLQDRRNADLLDCRIDRSQLRLHEKLTSFIGKTFSPWINASKLVKTAGLWAIAKLSLWKGKTLSPWINASKLVKMAGL